MYKLVVFIIDRCAKNSTCHVTLSVCTQACVHANSPLPGSVSGSSNTPVALAHSVPRLSFFMLSSAKMNQGSLEKWLFQGWSQERTEAWDISLCQKIRKCPINDGDMSQKKKEPV